MLCIDNKNTNPYFNLAAEEFALTNLHNSVFMLWRNSPAIIVGRYQNTLAEINFEYARKNNIKIVRRLTGGGAVFHDLGNLNFTFIENDVSANFSDFTQPIIEVLQMLGVPAKFEGRNDLTINGQKFSGNAQCISGGRMLHHGTLLFASKITDLSAALKANPLKFEDKAVKSVHSRVTNISAHLHNAIDVEQFAATIMHHIKNTRKNCIEYIFSQKDIDKIQQLANEKYSTWAWNFGESPKYALQKTARTQGGCVEININVKNGIIADIKIFGDFFSRCGVAKLETMLIGKKHSYEEIAKILQNINIDDYICGVKRNEILNLLF